MTVRDLIEKLKQADPDARVYVECNNDPSAQIVAQYNTNDCGNVVYICDDTEYLDGVINKVEGSRKKVF